MKDKIEVGEYVRTKDGKIDKVEKFSAGLCIWYCENGMNIDECNCIGTHLEDIVKHSKQLIDLIKVGDFVNGYRVISVDYDVTNDTTECIELDLNSNYQYNFISIRQIQTILTKEQYMANCYKVGGEDE